MMWRSTLLKNTLISFNIFLCLQFAEQHKVRSYSISDTSSCFHSEHKNASIIRYATPTRLKILIWLLSLKHYNCGRGLLDAITKSTTTGLWMTNYEWRNNVCTWYLYVFIASQQLITSTSSLSLRSVKMVDCCSSCYLQLKSRSPSSTTLDCHITQSFKVKYLPYIIYPI